MSNFLYFVPGLGASATTEQLTEIGLADRITKPVCRPCRGKTPNGSAGAVVVQNDGSGGSPIMDMENQTWRSAPKGTRDSPAYWIGFASADPPVPESLQRDALQKGVTVRCEGGGNWHVPVIRNFYEGDESTPVFYQSSLPQMVDFDDEGHAVASGVIPKYESIWEEALDVHKRLYAQALMQGDGSLTTSELYSFAAKCIAVNYRVSLLELSAMKALSTADCTAIVRNALDLENYEEIVGNFSSRLTQQDIDSSSGLDRQETEPPTQTTIDPALEK